MMKFELGQTVKFNGEKATVFDINTEYGVYWIETEEDQYQVNEDELEEYVADEIVLSKKGEKLTIVDRDNNNVYFTTTWFRVDSYKKSDKEFEGKTSGTMKRRIYDKTTNPYFNYDGEKIYL